MAKAQLVIRCESCGDSLARVFPPDVLRPVPEDAGVGLCRVLRHHAESQDVERDKHGVACRYTWTCRCGARPVYRHKAIVRAWRHYIRGIGPHEIAV